MPRSTPKLNPSPRHLFVLALAVIAVYVLLPQLGGFRSSWQLLRHPQALYTLVAAGLTFVSYVAASGTYCLLAFKPLLFGRTLLVQLAAMFINRLLPAGIGALGANYLYLRHERHKASQAGSIVAINNLLGLLGHGLLVAGTLLFLHSPSLMASGRHGINPALLLKVLGLVAIAALLLGLVFGRQRMARTLTDVKSQLLSYRRRPWSLGGALLTSMALTLCNVLCLLFCLLALGLHLPFAAVLLVFTFGVGTGAVAPTPGGLGGFEAGLAAGFVAYGIHPAPALATALLYRLISYWLPLGVGAVAFVLCQRQKFFEPAKATA